MKGMVCAAAAAAITGVRSLGAVSTLVRETHRDRGGILLGLVRTGVGTAALMEIAADKVGVLPPRTEPVPQIGRMVIGAAVGGWAARRAGGSAQGGAVVGAVTAVAVTRCVTSLRSRIVRNGTAPDFVVGLAEDGLVQILQRPLSRDGA